MPRVVMLIAPEMFRDEEYAEPHGILARRGAAVTTASSESTECTGKLGLRVTAEISLSEAASSTEWDAAVFVGGAGAARFFDDPAAHRLARETRDRGGIIAAICIAPSILAHAGLLEGVPATAFPSQRDDLLAHGAQWSDDPVVISGRMITANGPEAASRFGTALADMLDLPGDRAVS